MHVHKPATTHLMHPTTRGVEDVAYGSGVIGSNLWEAGWNAARAGDLPRQGGKKWSEDSYGMAINSLNTRTAHQVGGKGVWG